jgi:hypothetical protein
MLQFASRSNPAAAGHVSPPSMIRCKPAPQLALRRSCRLWRACLYSRRQSPRIGERPVRQKIAAGANPRSGASVRAVSVLRPVWSRNSAQEVAAKFGSQPTVGVPMVYGSVLAFARSFRLQWIAAPRHGKRRRTCICDVQFGDSASAFVRSGGHAPVGAGRGRVHRSSPVPPHRFSVTGRLAQRGPTW